MAPCLPCRQPYQSAITPPSPLLLRSRSFSPALAFALSKCTPLCHSRFLITPRSHASPLSASPNANFQPRGFSFFNPAAPHLFAPAASAERDDPPIDAAEESGSPSVCDPLCSVDETSLLDCEGNSNSKTDLFKVVTVFATVLAGAAIVNHSWVGENQDLAMILVFVMGYAGIVFEESLVFNKRRVGLLMAVTLWVIRSAGESGSPSVCDPLCSVDGTSLLDCEGNSNSKTDLFKVVTVFATVLAGAAIVNHSWVGENQDLAMILVFVIGYAGIVFEESLVFNKSGVGLLMAVTLWVIRSAGASTPDAAITELKESSGEVSEIVFFLLGAMTIVEIIDAHRGFKLVTDSISTRKPLNLLWVIGIVTFFLSSILDNLTSTIVMISLLRKLVPDKELRKFFGATVVIAANAGGAWTPIGDVTTTMLWINGQISTIRTMQDLLIPSALSLAVPLTLMSFTSEVNGKELKPLLSSEQMAPRGKLVLAVGIGALLFVPVFKAITGLPPYLGMLLGLGVLWILTDAIHYGDSEGQKLRVPQALSRIDTQGVLFFLGILLSVGSLQAAGVLGELASYLNAHIPSVELIASVIGLVSAVIDNVPLVAASMGMYDISTFPMDAELWQLIAYCAGTGGSILIIGSAAGVAFMGMERVDFFWYLKKVSGFAFAGYVAGIAAYLTASHIHLF